MSAPTPQEKKRQRDAPAHLPAPATSEPAVKKKRRLNLTFSSVEMEEEIRAWRPSGNVGATVNGTPSAMISPNLARKNRTAPVQLPVRSQPNGTPQKEGGAPGTSKSAESTASSSCVNFKVESPTNTDEE